jgi:hypothetical protein
VFVGIVCAVAGMAVQPKAETASLLALMERPTALDAFADQYGQAIVGELVKILAEQGDAACRKTRSIGEKELVNGAGELFVKYGTKLLAAEAGRVSEDALAAELDKDSGAGSASELRKLSDDHSVAELRKSFQSIFKDDVVFRVSDELDHYAALHRLYRGSIDPISSGNMTVAMVAADREIAAENAARKAVSDNHGADRLVELYVSAAHAYNSTLIQWDSFDVFDGVQVELKALCMPIRD